MQSPAQDALRDPIVPAAPDMAQGGGGTTSGFAMFAILALLLFLPPIPRFLLGASSLTVGLIIAFVLIVAMGMVGIYRLDREMRWQRLLPPLAITLFVVTLHSAVASLWFSSSVSRGAGSLAVTLVMIVIAYLTSQLLDRGDRKAFTKVVNTMSALFVIIAALSVLGLQPPASVTFNKPAFPFTEPSHLALAFAPFLIYQCVRSAVPAKVAWLVGTLATAYVLQNLSLVIVVGIAATCSLSGYLLVAGFAALVWVIANLNIEYFTDRLDFGAQTTNLSTLVYIQGLELIDAGWQATSGWGIGFQQLGIAPINVPTSDLIYRLSHDDANLRDGGFLAAKLIAEFGFVGAVSTICAIFFALRAGIVLRWIGVRAGAIDPVRIFALSLMASFMVELFVRSVGYYSGTVLLLISAIFLATKGGYYTRGHAHSTTYMGTE